MTDDRSPEGAAETRESRLETAVDDVFGVDFKILRTLRDLVIRPGRVADAALADDHSRYTRPLKVYVALFAMMTVALGWSGYGELNSITMTGIFANSPAGLAYVETRLAELGSSIAAADEVARSWVGWASWPAIVVASLILVLAIWAMRPRLGIFKSFQLYLVASNAAGALTIPVILARIFVGGGSVATASVSVAAMALFFTYAALVLHRRAADTALGLGFRTAGLVATMLPAAAAMWALSVATLEIAFRSEIGVSAVKLIVDGSRAAATQPGATR